MFFPASLFRRDLGYGAGVSEYPENVPEVSFAVDVINNIANVIICQEINAHGLISTGSILLLFVASML
jgi:hypothetical protein